MASRSMYRYTMRDGNRILKFGVTERPEQREIENQRNGVRGTMRIEGPRVTPATALDWEQHRIEAYLDRNGRLPPHNKIIR